AQESGQATARAIPPFQKLTGAIRWSKEMGVPPTEYRCAAFHVVVLDPEKNNKPVWFANVLTPGRDEPEFYTCKYEITLPTNKRLLVRAGLGDVFGTPSGALTRDPWERPGLSKTEEGPRGGFPLPQGTYLARVFKPAEMYVTLGIKGTYLKFEMFFGIKANPKGLPF
ncbi:MAG: hypothetical protein ABIO36_03415, partial [Pyrinomonadaceae bacterium]